MQLPPIVSEPEWQSAHGQLLVKEKQATRARDALAAERRRQPMMELSTEYSFEGPDGALGLPDLFEGRRQLIIYHFWFPADGEPCKGCSMVADQVSELAHLHARDTSFALVSRAPQTEIQRYERRMGWSIPWYTDDEDFQQARGTTDYFSLDVLLRDGDRVFLTYETRDRGIEAVGTVWSFLDRTPLGRQEEWEDTPAGRPQGPPYEWWRRHDEYESSDASDSA
jgi:predicted dithiol-disulfide oxidoreductase (DUF899 family)